MWFCVVCGNLQSVLLRLNLILFFVILADFSVAWAHAHAPLKHMIYKYKNHVDSNVENFQNVYLIYTEYIYIHTSLTFLLLHVIHKEIN